ncbi:hypothetical protein ONE63_005183 [Megalurothrips usitatus]|uniref:Fatty acid desaturase domain-containing protein n=1 Tax=Megalurothrips usitatus TaxID=439358 RepID=A0AAV7XYJ5_9NEOP|nr:hypothetical protein ONE63_005183 [Megalurothrips usitatus]
MAFQKSVICWCLIHRRHHKNSDTDADPHNIRRGFFFAHVGWMLGKKHPEVRLKGQTIDVSDLSNDPILAFQHRYYMWLLFVFCYSIPTVIPWYFWDEAIISAFFVAVNLRLLITLHVTFLINSAAHTFGYKPYDRSIPPGDVWALSFLTVGESWHNYHHSFPWDYKTSEYGRYSTNLTTAFIDLMAKIGWAYDLRTASPAVIEARINKGGDVALRRRY